MDSNYDLRGVHAEPAISAAEASERAAVDVRRDFLVASPGHSFCEFKGVAQYWSIHVRGERSPRAAWSYPDPTERFRAITDYLAFYASCVDGCWVGDERVQAQAGDFYGGWITSNIVGPFKGAPGTIGW